MARLGIAIFRGALGIVTRGEPELIVGFICSLIFLATLFQQPLAVSAVRHQETALDPLTWIISGLTPTGNGWLLPVIVALGVRWANKRK